MDFELAFCDFLHNQRLTLLDSGPQFQWMTFQPNYKGVTKQLKTITIKGLLFPAKRELRQRSLCSSHLLSHSLETDMNLNNLLMIFAYLNGHRPLPRLQTAPSPRCWSSLEVRLWSKRGKPQNERNSLWGEDVNARKKGRGEICGKFLAMLEQRISDQRLGPELSTNSGR